MSGELPFNAPQHVGKSKFILLAQVTAADGRADEAQKLLAKARADAESDKEPGTHTYRTSRAEGGGNNFVVFEEYASLEKLKEHVAGEAFQTLAASGALVKLDIQYFEEFS